MHDFISPNSNDAICICTRSRVPQSHGERPFLRARFRFFNRLAPHFPSELFTQSSLLLIMSMWGVLVEKADEINKSIATRLTLAYRYIHHLEFRFPPKLEKHVSFLFPCFLSFLLCNDRSSYRFRLYESRELFPSTQLNCEINFERGEQIRAIDSRNLQSHRFKACPCRGLSAICKVQRCF